jgi:serine/threonine-protein kinase RIM15
MHPKDHQSLISSCPTPLMVSGPHLQPLQPTFSNPMAQNTPPQQSMMPPVMALFDPEGGYPKINSNMMHPKDHQSLISSCPTPLMVSGARFENILHRRINWPDEPEELTSAESLDLMNRLMTLNQDKLKHDASQRPPVTDLILPNAVDGFRG